MLLLADHIRNAVESLRSTRMRTTLTTLGVAIGVASVTIILSLSGGITAIIDRQIADLGSNIAIIRPGAPVTHSNWTNPVGFSTYNTSTLTEKDIADIQKIPTVEAVAPIMTIGGTLRAGKTTVHNGTLVATTPGFAQVAPVPMRDGQFIDTVTNSNTAVLGPQLSVDLFGTEQSIGHTFTAHGQSFTVIGITKRLNSPISYNNFDLDHTAIISLEGGKTFHQGVSQIQQINIKAKNVDALPAATRSISAAIAANHRGEQDFTIITGKEIATPTSQLFIAIASVMTAIATISLIVGGIGIMNIMLVGVAERTREIGLRKSIGASSRTIAWQFLVESLIMSISGGIIGYVIGYVVALFIGTLLTFTPALSWQTAGVALAMSLIVGTVFGLYPAIRAARKDPIESLRQYH